MSRVPSLGAVLPQAEIRPSDPAAVLAFVREVERLGFDHLLAFEHVLGADSRARPDWDGYYDHTVPFLEPMALFAFLAQVPRLEFVTDILVAPQRQTALLAKQAATVDVLTGGRLRLGLGIGWNEVEYVGLGVPFRTRARRFEEQVPLLRRLLTEDGVDHAGEFDVIDRAGIRPLPARGVPLWIGCGDAPSALDRVGRLADGWIPHPNLGDGEKVEAGWRAVREAAERAGRDPDTLGLQGAVPYRHGAETVVDRLGRWIDLGATHVGLNTLEAGLAWPDAHLDVIRDVMATWQEALTPMAGRS
ncbi:LLM class F420-dependent oxidoreductase [Trujillonella endophytica]|uniref:Probable F420-dependent oxidoreductase, Rv2161c family n=1 Tax=Trujillonella endophytica TaxID=673521 RepID=A0A1H8Q5N1_9ACTN|nr:LLM class F420-dependent oxidoreductase [Trujillella endophytica]SEO49529.1 probable F420-dependent oxidoreductase, Rv2161c family [Trujillella endophytica]